jgi:hypothetical protein
MSRIKHCDWCGEPQKEIPCETCGADEDKIRDEMIEREGRLRAPSLPAENKGEAT